VLDREAARGRLLDRIQLRAGDYLTAEVGWSGWRSDGAGSIGLVGSGAMHGYWEMVKARRRRSVASGCTSAAHREDACEARFTEGRLPLQSTREQSLAPPGPE